MFAKLQMHHLFTYTQAYYVSVSVSHLVHMFVCVSVVRGGVHCALQCIYKVYSVVL